MRNTTPEPPLGERNSADLLEALCIALRKVAVSDSSLPSGEVVVGHINSVREIHSELTRRNFDCTPRLQTLSEETRWQIPQLLDDCLLFPASLPFVREPDGIRRTLRCQRCKRAERPRDAELFWFCDACMQRLSAALRDRKPLDGVVLFRTFNPECRSRHADSDTVLAAGYYYEELSGVCEQCIQEELSRRHATDVD